MATPFFPRFPPAMMFTQLRRMLQPEKKQVFLTRSEQKSTTHSFPPNPKIQKKNVFRISKDKSQCVLCPRSNRTPLRKKKSLCTLPAPLTPVSPPFVKGNCKTRRGEERGRKEVGLGMDASLICGFGLISVGYLMFGLNGLGFKAFYTVCLQNQNFRAQVQAQAYP